MGHLTQIFTKRLHHYMQFAHAVLLLQNPTT